MRFFLGVVPARPILALVGVAAMVAVMLPAPASVAANNGNGANLRDVQFKAFTYNRSSDSQKVKLTWKAKRGHSFEIYIEPTATSQGKLYLGHRGTSLELIVPANATLRGAIRAARHPGYQIPFAFESPLQFNNLLFPDWRGCLRGRATNAQDRSELWTVIERRKLTGRLGYFALVAPPFLNAAPGSKLSEAVAGTVVGVATDIFDPLSVSDFVRGLSAIAENGSRGYFSDRCYNAMSG